MYDVFSNWNPVKSTRTMCFLSLYSFIIHSFIHPVQSSDLTANESSLNFEDQNQKKKFIHSHSVGFIPLSTMSEKASQSFNGSDKHVQVIARPRFDCSTELFVLVSRSCSSRPLSDNERAQSLTSCLSVNETRREIVVNGRTSNNRYFNYDHVFGSQTRQQEVYKAVVAPIVDEVLKGYSSTIFA